MPDQNSADFNPPPQPSPSRGEGEVGHNQVTYSVSEIAGAIKHMVEDRFGRVRLRGEISGWKGAHSSGHAYFRIKDDSAVIDAVCWRGSLARLACKPEEGMEVIATGRITTYPSKSSYQIVVETIEPAGVGALMAILEKRKKQLEAEGLFAPERKKKLPFLPRVVGVITSPTGAVIRDILHRIEARCGVHVLVWPVAVQGEGAAEQIAAAINGFNSLKPETSHLTPDILIVARGGGSIEDLWAFNEEIVVRAAAASTIPLISAVGHETDTTLMDYAADMRAPTPTAAAEMAVPVLGELMQSVQEKEARLSKAALRLLDLPTQKLDDWSERLSVSLPALLENKAQKLAVLSAKLQPKLLLADVMNWQKRLSEWQERLNLSFTRALDKRSEKLANIAALLESLNYKKVLERGYALVRDGHGHVVSSVEAAKNAAELTISFKDGEMKIG